MNERLTELYNIYTDTYEELYNSHTELTEIIESHFCRLHDNDMKHDPDYRKAVQTNTEKISSLLTENVQPCIWQF